MVGVFRVIALLLASAALAEDPGAASVTGATQNPDILVSLQPYPGCQAVDPARLQAGRPATCSLQAAVDFVNLQGDPTPGDDRVVIGVTAGTSLEDFMNCRRRSLSGGPGAGERRRRSENVVVENHRLVTLSIRACGVVLDPSERSEAVLTIQNSVGPVEIEGLDIQGGARESYLVRRNLAPVSIRDTVVAHGGVGIRVEHSPEVVVENAAIRGVAGDGLLLEDTSDVTLRSLTIDACSGSGIRGLRVTNLVLDDARITNNTGSSPSSEAGLFFRNLWGEAAFSGTTVSGSAGSNATIINNESTPLDLTISGSKFLDNGAARGEDGLDLRAIMGGRMKVRVESSVFTGNRNAGIRAAARDRGSLRLAVTRSTFRGGDTALSLSSAGRSRLTFDLTDNLELRRFVSNGINIYAGDTSTLSGTISGNPISGCTSGNGIGILAESRSTAAFAIAGNTIDGIRVGAGISAQAPGGSAALDLAIADNEVVVDPATGREGIYVESRNEARVCADISGNHAVGGPERAGIRLRQRGRSTFRVAGLAADAAPPDEVEALVGEANPATARIVATVGVAFAGGGPCRDSSAGR